MSVVDALRRGEIVLLETDTLVGLHGLATHAEVIKKLTDLKGSASGRGFLLLFLEAAEVFEVGEAASPQAEAQLRALWPGPLTAVLRARPQAPAHWSTEQDTLAARVPARASLREVLAQVGGPLFSTSANRSGQPPAQSLAEARREFPLLTASSPGEEFVGVASTVVDFTVDPPRLMRAGALPWPPDEERDFVPLS